MFQLERKYCEIKNDVLDVWLRDTYWTIAERATKCYNCRAKNQHTSICENNTNIDDKKDSIDDNEENEEKVVMLIDAKTDVLLQTADCIISNPRETKELKIKVLLDPGSQKTYLSDAVKDYLKLDAITKQKVAIKTFGSTNGQLKELGEFKFALRELHGNCLYMSEFCVLVICVL